MKLELNWVEQDNAKAFLNKLPEHISRNSDVCLKFTPGSIGTRIIIEVEKYSEDITDYGCW